MVPDNMAELLAIRENCRELEIERDKYREVVTRWLLGGY